jgi:hypothetical protein
MSPLLSVDITVIIKSLRTRWTGQAALTGIRNWYSILVKTPEEHGSLDEEKQLQMEGKK